MGSEGTVGRNIVELLGIVPLSTTLGQGRLGLVGKFFNIFFLYLGTYFTGILRRFEGLKKQ